MAIRKNADGSITVGIIPEAKQEVQAEKPAEAKKPTKKSK